MKTQNRPELKVGDRVRFRSDGEIGELNRSQNINTEIFHIVKKICKDGRVYHEGGGSYAQVQFDICNDFSDIQVGDKVERYWKYGITTDTVVSVSDNEFKLENCEKIGCGLSISKADGIHGDWPWGGDFWYVLRIVEKAKPKPLLADAKVGDLCKTDLGEWIQIDDSSEPPSPVLYHFDRPFKGNIIRTEPLAPEDTAEWAWQMLNLLGLPIYHPAEGVLTIPVPYSSERFAHCYAKTGWQIHEPEPKPATQNEPIDTSVTGLTVTIGNALYTLAGRNGEPSSSHYESIEEWIKTSIDSMQKQHKPEPKFNVGDWVETEIGFSQVKVTEIKPDGSYWSGDYKLDKITRKLSPFEVEVDFGFAKGRILSKMSGDVKVLNNKSVVIATIIVSEITNPTIHSLVESLLKAQKEEK